MLAAASKAIGTSREMQYEMAFFREDNKKTE
jgi:hypothetical protein